MCGILGYIGKRDFAAEAFGRALDTMAKRGPDDRGIFEAADALLGHRRLAILDLSAAAHQPMVTSDGRYVIVLNGEVYNFKELRKPLEDEGVHFISQSDTEVILALYARRGPECLHDFRGMFAIAIWDTLEKTLFLARDRMGIKPLYVWRLPGGIAFGSEVKALRALSGGAREIDPEAVAQYLLWGSVPEPLTITRNVRCLPPSTWALWKNGSWTQKSYWDFPTGEPVFKRRDEALEALRPQLLEAVRLRCISDVPLGAFLSGGIDSSSVVNLMRASGQQHIHTFSISFPQTAFDEAPYALKVAERFGTHHTDIAVSEQMVREELDGFYGAMDQPTCDGVNTYLVSKFARQGGLTVSLSGLGGDELFAGYPLFSRARRFVPWLRAVPRPALRASAAALRGKTSRWSKLDFLALNGRVEGRFYAASRALFTPTQVGRLLQADVLAQTSLSPAPGRPPEIVPGVPDHFDTLHATMVLELHRYMHNQLLRDSDVFGMAQSLEIRVPFIDHKVVDLIFRIAPGHITSRTPKSLLMDALPTSLPRECTHRPKMGFTFPFDTWLKSTWRPMIEETLLGPGNASSANGLFDTCEIDRVWRGYLAGRTHWSRPWAIYSAQRSFGIPNR